MRADTNKLKLLRLGIDTQNEFIVYMHKNCFVCKSEGFAAETQIIVTLHHFSIVATLNIIHSDILNNDEASLSESAWIHLNAKEGDLITLSHLKPVTSLKYIRSKIYGNEINAQEFQEIDRKSVV